MPSVLRIDQNNSMFTTAARVLGRWRACSSVRGTT